VLAPPEVAALVRAWALAAAQNYPEQSLPRRNLMQKID
jgi:hypothetical protein